MSAELTGGPAGELVPVGDGPSGPVLAAVDADTGQAYALKVLSGPVDDRAREQFAREHHLLSALRGRAPVVVPDGLARLDDGRWAVRRELCTQSLPELVAFSGPLPTADVLSLARTLAEALAAVHRVGVVHGSVTPANVLFRPSGEAVLVDAGLGLRRTQAGRVDERSDLYGLGAVLHFAATGRPPPPRPGDAQATDVPAVDDPGGVRPPAGLAALTTALLAEDSAHRPRDALAVVAELRSLSQDAPAVSFPAGGPLLEFGPALRRRPRLPRWWVIAVAAAVLMAAVLPLQRPTRPGVAPVGPLSAGSLSAGPLSAQPVSSAAAPDRSGAPVRVALAEPVDGGAVVDLSWTSSAALDFVVVAAGEGEPPRRLIAQRSTRYQVRVDPQQRYCFTVQGTNGDVLVSSATRPIRGAHCPA